MSAVLPPALPPLAPGAGGAGGPVSVTVSSGAVALAEGAMLQAIAQARAARGTITAQGPNGPLELKTTQPLPPIPEGAKLLLQVIGKGDEARLSLLAVNGRPLAGVTLPPGLGLPPAGPGLVLPGAPALAGPLAPGGALPPAFALPGQLLPEPGAAMPPVGITATVIRPAVSPGEPTQAAGALIGLPAGLGPDLPAGTQLTVRIAEVGTPQPAATHAAVPAAGQPSPAQAAGQPAGTPSTAQATPQAAPGASPAPAQPTVPAAPLLPGTVTAQSPGGQALVLTPIGALSLPTAMTLPAGTPLTLEVVGKPMPPAPAAAAAAPLPPPAGLTAQGWPAFTQAVEVLTAASQAKAVEELLRVMPQPGPRLAASMAAFAGAVKADGRALVPDSAVRGLDKAGRKDLAERLKGDLEALTEEAGRPVGGGEWRGFTLPFLSNGYVEPIRLFVRGAGEEDGGSKRGGTGAKDQRFILDLSLSQLGRVQMDGLVRREDKLFDLIIRTDAPLSPEMRQGILGIFTNASELVGTKGSVSFQAGGRWMEFPPLPPEPTRIEV